MEAFAVYKNLYIFRIVIGLVVGTKKMLVNLHASNIHNTS